MSLSKGSDTLKLAGERGFWPLSLNLIPTYVGSHWEAGEQGAALPLAGQLRHSVRIRHKQSEKRHKRWTYAETM